MSSSSQPKYVYFALLALLHGYGYYQKNSKESDYENGTDLWRVAPMRRARGDHVVQKDLAARLRPTRVDLAVIPSPNWNL